MIQTGTAYILAILLALLPHTARTRCAERRADEIAVQAEASSVRYDVPAALLLSICMHESSCGCDPRSGGSWGSPISRTRRAVAGGAEQTASAIALGRRRCGSWLAATNHFRTGRCHGPPPVGYTAEQALRLANRIALRAGAPALQ